jgi:hypothetical protein
LRYISATHSISNVLTPATYLLELRKQQHEETTEAINQKLGAKDRRGPTLSQPKRSTTPRAQ